MTRSARVIENTGRGSGRTTKAILAAPKNAYYVVHHDHSVHYTRDLAKHLGRDDLVVISIDKLKSSMILHGGAKAPVLMDHWLFAPEYRRPFHFDEMLASVSLSNSRWHVVEIQDEFDPPKRWSDPVLQAAFEECESNYSGPGPCKLPEYLRARAAYHALLARAGLIDPKLAEIGKMR